MLLFNVFHEYSLHVIVQWIEVEELRIHYLVDHNNGDWHASTPGLSYLYKEEPHKTWRVFM